MIYESIRKSDGKIELISDPTTPLQEIVDHLSEEYDVDISDGDHLQYWFETKCTPSMIIFVPLSARGSVSLKFSYMDSRHMFFTLPTENVESFMKVLLSEWERDNFGMVCGYRNKKNIEAVVHGGTDRERFELSARKWFKDNTTSPVGPPSNVATERKPPCSGDTYWNHKTGDWTVAEVDGLISQLVRTE